MSNINRRDFLIGGIAASVPFIGRASPVRAILGANGIKQEVGEHVISAADYVQNGLLALWDGIENIGWGEHDSDSIVWKDLIGASDFSIVSGKGHFTDNSFSSDLKSSSDYRSGVAPRSWSDHSIKRSECVFMVRSYPRPSTGMIVSRGNTTPGFILCANTNLVGVGNYFGVQDNCVNPGVICTISGNGTKTGGYINGESWTYNRDNGWNPNATSGITLGNRGQGSSAPFDGEIFSLRFYSRDLSLAEIAHNHEIDRIRFDLP